VKALLGLIVVAVFLLVAKTTFQDAWEEGKVHETGQVPTPQHLATGGNDNSPRVLSEEPVVGRNSPSGWAYDGREATGLRAQTQPTVDPQPTERPVEMTRVSSPTEILRPWDIYREYQENVIRADAKFLGKILTVHGVVDDISRRRGEPVLTIATESYTSTGAGVQCSFLESDEPKLMSIRRGQPITVSGLCRGLDFGLNFDNCQIIAQQ
jgi:hypothetical protein